MSMILCHDCACLCDSDQYPEGFYRLPVEMLARKVAKLEKKVFKLENKGVTE